MYFVWLSFALFYVTYENPKVYYCITSSLSISRVKETSLFRELYVIIINRLEKQNKLSAERER